MVMATLYERLGGDGGIAALVDEIVEAHMRNPQIEARFTPYRDDPAHLEAVKGHLREFLTSGSGGPGDYHGKSMREAHRGLNISEAEYMAAIDDILAVLDRHEIDPQTRQKMLGIAYSLKDDIMHV
ncbi:group 1 truncated hemoglobin [Marinobacter sp. TBZ242]|uniref:Group 1 truncated hemoglobin n=1 Tax=Marinobacter azerbaijanicus TaxID=3050455 RepID=A0ABT7II44_9GAMM|nr:group 1 truncated hemoglobin [Marinobacter sp. TBZ242]MDL0433856.1 group 1 truncated hemoglobin [Marinobacter sp. TBZ242]